MFLDSPFRKSHLHVTEVNAEFPEWVRVVDVIKKVIRGVSC